MIYCNTIRGDIFSSFGTLAVGTFFFLSAYGIMTQFRKRGNSYLKKLFFVNLPKLYLTLVFTNIIYLLVFHLGDITSANVGFYILQVFSLLWTTTLNSASWFMYTLMVFYLAFIVLCLIFSKCKNNHVLPIILAIMPLLFTLIIFIVAPDMVMFGACVDCFSLGILYANYKTQMDAFFKKHFRWSVIISLIAVIFSMFYSMFTAWIISLFACILLILFSYKFSISNKILSFLGKISFYIYLLHIVFYELFVQFATNEYLFILLTSLCTITSATALYYSIEYITKIFKRKKQIKVVSN